MLISYCDSRRVSITFNVDDRLTSDDINHHDKATPDNLDSTAIQGLYDHRHKKRHTTERAVPFFISQLTVESECFVPQRGGK